MDRSENGRNTKTQVLISGAGPTGLLLAVELQRRGVDCLLIDELDAPRGWDRATVIHPRSLEIFEALGLAEQFLDQGARMRLARFHSDGELLGELDLELTDSPYGFDLQLSEETTERLLTGYLESVGGSVTRSTRLMGFVQGTEGVTATLERDGVRFEVEAEWPCEIGALGGAIGRLADAERAALRGIRPQARLTLPMIVDTDGARVAGARVTSLVLPRLQAAGGLIEAEAP